MPPAGLEPAVPVSELSQTHALGLTATPIGTCYNNKRNNDNNGDNIFCDLGGVSWNMLQDCDAEVFLFESHVMHLPRFEDDATLLPK
jgi:hypothetical protein